ncbi:sensor histidine kinase [Sphingomonas xanthus]|nr:HAMP domain-containing sensor histidine kinase [Sphingomonas xanthus]
MASAPNDRGPVTGRVDRAGRLVSAGQPLQQLQEEAGSKIGELLAIPQLAAVARSAMKLGVPLSRSIIAAASDRDLDLWVRVDPDGEGATLTIEGWHMRPPAPPRLTLVEPDPASGAATQAMGQVLATDADLNVTAIDEGLVERFGKEKSAIVGQSVTRLFALIEDDEGGMPMVMALAGHHDFEGQSARVRGGDGSKLQLKGSAVRDGRGQFAGYEIEVGFEGDRAGGGSLFDASLDDALRSPLDRIIAAADRIVDRSEGPLRSDYAAYAGDIAAAGRHLLSVIRAMTEQKPGDADRINVAQAARDAIQLVQANAAEKNIQIEPVGSAPVAMALGDSRAAVQIIVNLLGNAVRHSPVGSTIAVIVEQAVNEVAVTIADEGPGIDPVDQQRIFERYERVGTSSEGIGLGLAISRRLARSMNGDIRLKSAPGEGARFTLVLPIA